MNERAAEIIKEMNALGREIKYNDNLIQQNGIDIDKMMDESEKKIIENQLKGEKLKEYLEELKLELSKV